MVYLKKRSREAVKSGWLREAQLKPGLADLCTHLINPPHLATNPRTIQIWLLAVSNCSNWIPQTAFANDTLASGLVEETFQLQDKTPWQSDRQSFFFFSEIEANRCPFKGFAQTSNNKVEGTTGKHNFISEVVVSRSTGQKGSNIELRGE